MEPHSVEDLAVSRRGLVLFVAMCVIWGIPYLLIKVSARGPGAGGPRLRPVRARRRAAGPDRAQPASTSGPSARSLGLDRRVHDHRDGDPVGAPLGRGAAHLELAVRAAGLDGAAHRRGDRRWSREAASTTAGAGSSVSASASSGSACSSGSTSLRPPSGRSREVLVVAICYATGPYIINRKLSDLPSLGVIASSLLLAAVAYAPAALIQLPHAWPSGEVIAAVLTLGVVCTALAFLVFFALIRRDRPGARDGDHVREPGGRGDPRGAPAPRTPHRRDRRGIRADPRRVGARGASRSVADLTAIRRSAVSGNRRRRARLRAADHDLAILGVNFDGVALAEASFEDRHGDRDPGGGAGSRASAGVRRTSGRTPRRRSRPRRRRSRAA